MRRWLPWSSLALLAILVWGIPLLAPDSLFWDDWVLLLGDPIRDYQTTGLPWVGYFTAGLMLLGPWAFKVVALLSAITTGLAAYGIAGARLGAGPFERWLMAALVVVAPLNVAQTSVGVLTNYSLSLAAFAVAWWLLVARPTTAPGPVRALLATVLFFASFTTASLLPFLAVAGAHFLFLYADWGRGVLRALGALLARYWYLLAGPIVFWVVHERFFPATGVYVGYNSISLPDDPTSPLAVGIVLAVVAIVVSVVVIALRRRLRPRVARLVLGVLGLVYAAFFAWTHGSWQPAAIVIVAGMTVASLGLVALAATRRLATGTEWLRTPEGYAALGFCLIAVGSLPYLLVRKLPTFQDWETRYQLLLPFGVALVLMAGLRVVRSFWSARPSVVVGGVLGATMACAAAFGPISLLADWQKQEQVLAALEATPDVAAASTVMIQDTTASWNYGGRAYRFYEWSALLKAAYGGPARLAIPEYPGAMTAEEVAAIAAQDPARYGVAGWSPGGAVETVRITQTGGYHWWDLLLGRARFRAEIVEH